MAFRADEASEKGFERAKSRLIPQRISPSERSKAEDFLLGIIKEFGPVVDSYPTWHPLVPQLSPQNPEQYPSERCGYKGLDHTVCFVNCFITCPYGDGEDIINSVSKIKDQNCAAITSEKLDANLYAPETTPILVRCDWQRPLDEDGTIPKSIAVPLMLEQEVPVWRWSSRAENWETMRPYLLGEPHGSRSSLFVNQDTAMAIKRIYISLIESGMFGPIKY